MIKAPLLAALAIALPVVASAGSLTLSEPLAGGTLREGTVDMSVYTQPAGETGVEVVAFYTERAGAEPLRLAMRLEEGDSTTFGLPGVSGVSYRFERSADAVIVTSAPARTELALN
ncbi:hypothetical protein [Alloyangia pacifica]|uniref:Uncharacterized protein n=1 Tax=Alloyangia pacifica TaxID=311180 RepID=A0A1I6W2K5_9RHOB|nr:hypothetical protein [Alloyangia pacifica]SDI37351.1 hypothetical protein SAMN04488245_11528 [Alloyangia pacifica]SFT19874.1 hypothetical protein SAMN04488050_11429 [Alloyangia pacifica]